MDLQLLARAKLLLASSTEINTADANDGPAAGKGLPPRTVPKNGFVVSVIPGSSLINTSVDVRLCVRRGGEVLIDGMPYATALDGEWSSSCIQLSTDFIGDTKFDARLTLSKDAEPPRFNTNSDKQKTSIKPVASTDIAGAVQNLSAVQRDFKVKKDEMKMASRQTTFRNKKDVSANSEFSRVGAELDKIDRENVREESPRAPLFPNSLGASEASAERKTGSMRGLYRSPHSTKRERERVSSSKSLESDKRDYVSTIPSPRAAYDYSSILQEAAAVALAVTEDPAEAAKRRVKERIARRRKKQIAEQQQQEEEERARLEREEAKVKQMQERTRQRVKKLREEAKQREEEEREWMELKMREVKEREAAFDNPERQERARAIRREAASRVRAIEKQKRLSEELQQAQVEGQLREIKKRFDRATTYVPHLDNPRVRNRKKVISTLPPIARVADTAPEQANALLRSRTAGDSNSMSLNASDSLADGRSSAQHPLQGCHRNKDLKSNASSAADFNGSEDDWKDSPHQEYGSPPKAESRVWSRSIPEPTSQRDEELIGKIGKENKMCNPERRPVATENHASNGSISDDDDCLSDLTPEPAPAHHGTFRNERVGNNAARKTDGVGQMPILQTVNERTLTLSNERPSPTRKVEKRKKNKVWRKLAPIPISVPYQPTVVLSS